MAPLGTLPDPLDEPAVLRRLFNHLPAMVAFWDAQARNVVANDAYLEWFGWSPERLRGHHISELLGDELYALNLPFITAALAGEEQVFDRTLVDTLGRTRHTQAHYVPELVDGEVRGFFVLVADVTAHVEAQRELAEVQRLARVGSWTEQRLTGELAWSDGMYRIFGLEPGQPPARDEVVDLVHPEDRDQALAVAQAGIDAAEDTESRFRIVRPDGAVRFVHGRTSVVTRDGEVLARRGTLIDETEVQEASARVNEVNERLSDLVGVIGHDVRTPTTAVRGFLDLAESALAGGHPDQALALVRRAQKSALRLDGLLTNILSMAQLDAGDLAARQQPLDARELVDSVLADLPAGEQLSVEVAPGLSVLAEPAHAQLVLSNLLANALKYGEPPYAVTVAARGDEVELCVTDHGEGVPEDFRPRLFDRFARAESGVATDRSGSGLGLYIVRRLCEVNGGSIRHEQGPGGRGATFVVRLPRG
ncbi:sensor histidine kinase [Nocardioides marmoribigeumensis]|jgi:PAS domain S-box-containing protein|uniref:histidine kinase n=1 Tax=Nocardioides marmoribigeumensis TaxID=433649 RepID=A0ABU2BXB1_9ACTN|nr:PAS domain-containing sensor histidine kinase [Nocardioides marmoribigeumensis]MDR7363038.1 PAS domain S-box-containing protein [Nocardioides marmoribigeumensis]